MLNTFTGYRHVHGSRLTKIIAWEERESSRTKHWMLNKHARLDDLKERDPDYILKIPKLLSFLEMWRSGIYYCQIRFSF